MLKANSMFTSESSMIVVDTFNMACGIKQDLVRFSA